MSIKLNEHVKISAIVAATGYSRNTVSKVLNDRGYVSLECKKKVLETVKSLTIDAERKLKEIEDLSSSINGDNV